MIPALVNSLLLSRGRSTSVVPGANNFVQPFQPLHRRPKLDKSGALIGGEKGNSILAVTGTTFNPADASANVTLSNSNLTATYTSASDGGVRSISSKTSGKYYVEFAKGSPFNGGDSGLGIALASANLATIGLVGAGGLATFPSGSIYFNGSNTGLSLGATATIIGMAIDLGNQKGWFIGDAGTWNGSGSDNPATNTGGVNIAAIFPGAGAFIVCCSNQSTSNVTLNAGNSAFVKAVPSGFTAGWPA